METYDLIMLAVLTAATMLGAWQGMAWQFASFGSVVLSYMVACSFREPVAGLIQTKPPWDRFPAMLILYICTSLLVWIAFQIVARFIDRLKLKEFDRQVGAVLGLAKGLLLCVVVTLFSITLLDVARRQAIVNSYSGYCIAVLLNRADSLIPDEVHEVLNPALAQFERRLDGPAADTPDDGGPAPLPSDVAQPPTSDFWSAVERDLDEGPRR